LGEVCPSAYATADRQRFETIFKEKTSTLPRCRSSLIIIHVLSVCYNDRMEQRHLGRGETVKDGSFSTLKRVRREREWYVDALVVMP
jgi:hypothetical protein